MSTKAFYPRNEIGAGKPGFAKTRSIIEAAFYGNNVVKVNTLKEAYNLAKDVYKRQAQACAREICWDSPSSPMNLCAPSQTA